MSRASDALRRPEGPRPSPLGACSSGAGRSVPRHRPVAPGAEGQKQTLALVAQGLLDKEQDRTVNMGPGDSNMSQTVLRAS
uniref:Uncharacterized protein n=1 Tax=Sphaerodactylus townsendi TaxID=933632 RepID=A0ACB8EPC3_9SAUR